MGERLASLPRLVRATFRGEYTGTTRGRLLMVAAGVLYIISPVDVLPEVLLPLVGLADDAVVLSAIAAWLVNETEAYLAWEKSAPRSASDPRSDRRSGTPSDTRSGAPSDTRSGTPSDTVPGHVVR
jgi:uncharacterized membrane protein YkvA (DUF1232 family)